MTKMMLRRRQAVTMTLGAGLVASGVGHAQGGFPTQPIRMIVTQTPGSNTDIVARLFAEPMAQDLGQPVVVENRAGANGLVATSYLKQQRPDGYTIMAVGVSLLAFNPHLYSNLPYDPATDFTYIAPMTDTPFVLIASRKSGITSVAQLIERAKAQPGKLTFSSAGIGNSTHLATEMIGQVAGVELMHVPYSGAATALTAVISGEIDLAVLVLGVALPQITSGAVVPLASVSRERQTQLPDLPTIAQAGVDAPIMPGWLAIVGPAGMPQPITDRLNASVQKALADPVVKRKLEEQALIPLPGSAAAIRERTETDSRTWGAFIRQRGLIVQ